MTFLFGGSEDPAYFATLVRWTGCQAPVVLVTEQSLWTSHFRLFPVPLMVIGLRDDAGGPTGAATLVVLHEAAHCLQFQGGREIPQNDEDMRALELDADRGGSDLMCRLGLDGPALYRGFFRWAFSIGYRGDTTHGSVAQRLQATESAPTCQLLHNAP